MGFGQHPCSSLYSVKERASGPRISPPIPGLSAIPGWHRGQSLTTLATKPIFDEERGETWTRLFFVHLCTHSRRFLVISIAASWKMFHDSVVFRTQHQRPLVVTVGSLFLPLQARQRLNREKWEPEQFLKGKSLGKNVIFNPFSLIQRSQLGLMQCIRWR